MRDLIEYYYRLLVVLISIDDRKPCSLLLDQIYFSVKKLCNEICLQCFKVYLGCFLDLLLLRVLGHDNSDGKATHDSKPFEDKQLKITTQRDEPTRTTKGSTFIYYANYGEKFSLFIRSKFQTLCGVDVMSVLNFAVRMPNTFKQNFILIKLWFCQNSDVGERFPPEILLC